MVGFNGLEGIVSCHACWLRFVGMWRMGFRDLIFPTSGFSASAKAQFWARGR